MSMAPEIERVIMHYYPQRVLQSPLDNDGIRWDYDADHRVLKSLVADLTRLDPGLRPGTRGGYDVSEELVLMDELRLLVCYLGPYVAWSHDLDLESEDGREVRRRAEVILREHGLVLLDKDVLEQSVPWIQHGTHGSATVFHCLFVNDEA